MADVRTTHRGPVGYSTYSDQMIYDFESSYGAHHYSRQHLVVRKAEGIWLHDEKGDRYLDCLAAYSAVNQGHHHPRIVQAVVEALQSGYGSVISNVVYTDPLGVFLKKLATLVPQMGPRFGDNGNKVLPKNGGVESVETAVK
ncbi:MAG TPA: aminotransferase class III-fold pyridoxal phosphate-dependent enzyme, partial [candidate division Zixibacteria bacterium]|nr:aminotransferase class III-fold pyridoxal phosphate-dependent enzyme [candidate division Zixibacteria bacterium]